MLFSEQVFAWWNLATLLQYADENWLSWTKEDALLLLEEFDSAPVGFIAIDGMVAIDTPYWNEKDLRSDLEIIKEDYGDEIGSDRSQSAYVEDTLSLEHDDMCTFLCKLLDEAKVAQKLKIKRN